MACWFRFAAVAGSWIEKPGGELAVLRLAHGVEPPGGAKGQTQDPVLRPVEVERRELGLVRVRRHEADPMGALGIEPSPAD